MNWRRGLLLAGINLLVAVPLILLIESKDAAYVRDFYVPSAKGAETPVVQPSPAPDPKDEAVSFNMCSMLSHDPPQEVTVSLTNMPASFLAGWRIPCPARWMLSGTLHANGIAPPTPSSMVTQRKIDIGLVLLIALQWVLVGGFPLRRPRKSLADPEIFITVCGVLSAALLLMRPIEGIARLPALFAMFAWFWWLGLLAARLARFGWTWSAQHLATHTN